MVFFIYIPLCLYFNKGFETVLPCPATDCTVAGSFARYLAGFALPASGPPETVA